MSLVRVMLGVSVGGDRNDACDNNFYFLSFFTFRIDGVVRPMPTLCGTPNYRVERTSHPPKRDSATRQMEATIAKKHQKARKQQNKTNTSSQPAGLPSPRIGRNRSKPTWRLAR